MIRRSLTLLGAILLPAAPGLAAPPYTTDDAGVLTPGEVQLTPYADAVFRPGHDGGEVGIDATVGIVDRVEFGAALPLHSLDSADDRFALGDLALHAKFMLSEGGDGRPAITLAPILGIPTHADGRAEVGLDFPIYASFEGKDWALHAGGGYRFQVDADGGGLPFGGIVYDHALGERVRLGGELYAEGGGIDGKPLVMIGPGLSWAISDQLTFTAACHAILAHRAENGQFHMFAALVITP